ncbi:MAG: protein translocase subunit SecD [Acidimicrobiia bacterium]
MRRNWTFLIVTVVLVIGTFLGALALDKSPVLGLDLQGGVSVVLTPKGDYSKDSLDVAVDIIRTRVDSLGTLEPEITRSGSGKDAFVQIDLPGVKDREKAVKLVGTTGTLRFRPVLANLPAEGASTSTTTTTTGTTVPGATTTAPTTTTTLPKTEADAAAIAAVASCDTTLIGQLDPAKIPTTKPADDAADKCIVAKSRDGKSRYLLGPTALAGKGGVSGAKSQFAQGTGYVVLMDLTDSGAQKFNALAAKSFGQPSPTNEVAIVLDGVVQSAPAFQASSFSGPVQISGNFTQSEATDLAKLIQYGGLPVVFERGNVETVSPSLGKDQLHAGIIAGIIGLALVAIYMLVFYRILGLVVIAGIVLSGMALFTLVAWLLPAMGITIVLGLSGVTGIIVSVGITVDSYIVYFEKMKDELRAGATVRSCVDRSFTKSFRTILAADLVSLIGAIVLYALAIGSVRGFALFLGISTVLDLLVSYFFMHPLVSIMARKPHLVRMKGFGIGSGLDHPEVVA